MESPPKLMDRYLKRFPSWSHIAPVYAVIVAIIYSWTILWFFWKLPSWRFYLRSGEILLTLAYSLVTTLAESLVVLGIPLLLGLLLPKKWFLDSFVARGAALAIAGLGYAMFLAGQFKTNDSYPSLSLKPWSVALALIVIAVLVFLAGRVGILRKILEALADRMTIFIYLSIPLSLLSLLAVLIRWFF